MRQPRDYQLEAIENFYAGRARGLRRMMLVLATGLGKTFTFSLLIKRLIEEESARVMVIAHREELISQAVGSISELIPRGQIGIVKASQRETHYPCVIASVQSIATDKQRRNMPKFNLIVIDEAHRTLAKSYRAVIANLLSEQGCVLGVTATPQRADGGALAEVYEEIIFQMGLPEAIEKDWLCPLVGQRVALDADFSKLKLKSTTEGERDFDAREICHVMQATKWKEEVTRAWLEYAPDRKTIGFLPSVAFSYDLAGYMREKGIRAVAIDGTTNKYERRRVIEKFGTEIQVLLNCALLVEGVDLPDADCILSATMTASLGRYMQSIGRGTRKAPGKQNCLILDVVGVSAKNRIREAFDLGVLKNCLICEAQSSQEYREVGKDDDGDPVHSCLPCFVQIECCECERRGLDKYFLKDEDGPIFICQECKPKGEARERAAKEAIELERLRLKQVDLLAEADREANRNGRFTPWIKRKINNFLWKINEQERVALLELPGKTIEIRRSDPNGDYYFFDNIIGGLNGRTRSKEEALKICTEDARKTMFGPGSAWSRQAEQVEATEKQIAHLIKLGLPFEPGISKAAASQLLSQFFESRRRKGATVGAR